MISSGEMRDLLNEKRAERLPQRVARELHLGRGGESAGA